jgi:hypothetical protein
MKDMAENKGKCYRMIGGDTCPKPLKYQDDIAKVHGSEAAKILDEVQRAAGTGGV